MTKFWRLALERVNILFILPPKLEHVVWQPSEKLGNTASVEERVINADLANLKQTWLLDINCPPDSSRLFDFVYASNVLQCISLNELELFMLTARKFLKDSGMLVIYGPFLRDGEYASVGDKFLDNHLKINNQEIGIKDLETVKKGSEITETQISKNRQHEQK